MKSIVTNRIHIISVVIICVWASVTACKTRRTDPDTALAAQPVLFPATDSLNITARIYKTAPFRPNTSYVAMNIDFTTIEPLRQELEQRYGVVLKSRNEAHITLISPPEMKVLRTRLTTKAINGIVKNKIQSAKFEVICVGKGEILQNDTTLATYFLVVRSEELMTLRLAILEAFMNKGGQADQFVARKYYPHITIGFTHRDLHEEDGILKDERSCIIETSVI